MKNKLVNRMILATWIILFCCLIFKIFSNSVFEILVTNEKFIEITQRIDSSIWLQALVYLPFSITGNTLLILAILGNSVKGKKVVFLTILAVFVEYAAKILITKFVPNYATQIDFAFDTAFIVLFPLIFKGNYIASIAGYLIDLGIQSLSLVVRNFSIKVIVNDSISSLILVVDVLLMYVLFFLYRKREV